MKKHIVAPEIKEQIINRIKNDGVTVVQASKEHGIAEGTIYGWIAKNIEGQPTLSENIKITNQRNLTKIGNSNVRLKKFYVNIHHMGH